MDSCFSLNVRKDMKALAKEQTSEKSLASEKSRAEDNSKMAATFREELTTVKAHLSEEQKKRNAEVNEKEREKIQATEKLRKEMLYKIKETKANLLALNDEQL